MKRNEVLTPNPLHSILRALLKNGGALFMTLIASTRQTIFRSVKASFAAPRAGLSTKLLRAAVLLILVCVSSVASAQSLTVEWSNGRLTVLAADAPLAAVLTEVARQTHSKFYVSGDLSATIAVEIRGTTLVKGLQILLHDVNYILAGPDVSKSGDAASGVRVWLHAPGSGALVQLCSVHTPTSAHSQPSDTPAPCGQESQAENGEEPMLGGVGLDLPASEASIVMSPSETEVVMSPSEQEIARLVGAGFFDAGATTDSLLAVAKSPNEQVRIRALEILAVQATKAGTEAIRAALQDESPFVRGEAMGLLASQSPGPESAQLLGELVEHEDPAVRTSAAMALGEQNGSEAEFLLKRALYGEDEAVKDIATRALQEKETQQEQEKARPK